MVLSRFFVIKKISVTFDLPIAHSLDNKVILLSTWDDRSNIVDASSLDSCHIVWSSNGISLRSSGNTVNCRGGDCRKTVGERVCSICDCSSGFLVNVWLGFNIFMNISFSFNVMALNGFFMDISFSSNFFMYIWLGSNFFMNICLSSYIMSLHRFIMDMWFGLDLVVNICFGLNVLILWGWGCDDGADQENAQQKFHFVLRVYLAIIEWVAFHRFYTGNID